MSLLVHQMCAYKRPFFPKITFQTQVYASSKRRTCATVWIAPGISVRQRQGKYKRISWGRVEQEQATGVEKTRASIYVASNKYSPNRTPRVLEPGIQQQNLCDDEDARGDEAEGADLRGHLLQTVGVVVQRCVSKSTRRRRREEEDGEEEKKLFVREKPFAFVDEEGGKVKGRESGGAAHAAVVSRVAWRVPVRAVASVWASYGVGDGTTRACSCGVAIAVKQHYGCTSNEFVVARCIASGFVRLQIIG
ncbi:hypothetical protein C8R44DRAFT_731264 [Mycena epipterygia]|nr:hypothetical protein C8R44DRAFT_731264 [Mycena epipterygia]